MPQICPSWFEFVNFLLLIVGYSHIPLDIIYKISQYWFKNELYFKQVDTFNHLNSLFIVDGIFFIGYIDLLMVLFQSLKLANLFIGPITEVGRYLFMDAN